MSGGQYVGRMICREDGICNEDGMSGFWYIRGMLKGLYVGRMVSQEDSTIESPIIGHCIVKSDTK